jgi:hypothetical protein
MARSTINSRSIEGIGSIDATGTVTAAGLTVDTDTLHIDSTNNRVGIGASSPSYKLDANGGSTTTPIAHIETTNTGDSVVLSLDSSNGFAAGGGNRMRFGRSTQGANSVEIGYDHDTSGFQVTRNGADLMTITGSGNVGIGTTTNNQSSSTASVTLNAASGMSAYELRNADVFSGYVGHNGTNMYLVNAKNGSLGLYTNNTERMHLTSTGNVGIGRIPSTYSSPGVALEIGDGHSILGYDDNFHLSNNAYYNSGWYRNFTGTATNLISANGQWTFRNAVSGSAGTGISWTERFRINSNGSLTATASLTYPSGNGPAWGATYITGHSSSHFINFFTNGTERLRIDSNGNVGIGTSNPGELLHLSLPSGINGDIMRLSRSAGSYSFQLGVSSGATSNLYISDSSNNKIIDFTSGGNVGIGTSTPSTKLHVKAGSGEDAELKLFPSDGSMDSVISFTGQDDNTTSEGAQIWYDNDVGDFHIVSSYDHANGGIRFHTRQPGHKQEGNERLTITGDGNVGIGNSNPNYRLKVGPVNTTETIAVQSAGGGAETIMQSVSGSDSRVGSSANTPLNLITNNVSRMTIDTSGRVTMPYQPTFYAYGTAAYQAQGGSGFAYSSTTFNRGGHYNTSTYRFTAPVAGLYYFSVAAIMQASAADGGVVLVVNGTFRFAKDYTNGPGRSSNVSSVIYLNANDYVFVDYEGNSTWYLTDGYGFFSGYLIG